METTLSFAMKPVMSAVDTLQSPNPSGRNMGEIMDAMAASMLSALSATGLSLASNDCRNQITMDAAKIIVKALVAKSFVFSQISCPTFFADGMR